MLLLALLIAWLSAMLLALLVARLPALPFSLLIARLAVLLLVLIARLSVMSFALLIARLSVFYGFLCCCSRSSIIFSVDGPLFGFSYIPLSFGDLCLRYLDHPFRRRSSRIPLSFNFVTEFSRPI